MTNIYDKLTCITTKSAPYNTDLYINVLANDATISGDNIDPALVSKLSLMKNTDSKRLQDDIINATSFILGIDVDGDVVTFGTWTMAMNSVIGLNRKFRIRRKLCMMWNTVKNFPGVMKKLINR